MADTTDLEARVDALERRVERLARVLSVAATLLEADAERVLRGAS
jgi:hypothetical protein